MRQKPLKSPKLFSDFNTPQFACVMAMVLFVLLLIFMVQTTPFHYGNGLPKVSHWVSMPGALREDSMTVSVTRDGLIYFDSDRVAPAQIPERIAEHLKDRDVERKVYIRADSRAYYGAVKQVLEGVQAAQVLKVAFLVNEGKPRPARR